MPGPLLVLLGTRLDVEVFVRRPRHALVVDVQEVLLLLHRLRDVVKPLAELDEVVLVLINLLEECLHVGVLRRQVQRHHSVLQVLLAQKVALVPVELAERQRQEPEALHRLRVIFRSRKGKCVMIRSPGPPKERCDAWEGILFSLSRVLVGAGKHRAEHQSAGVACEEGGACTHAAGRHHAEHRDRVLFALRVDTCRDLGGRNS
eukprot:1697671-Rhodomonas_salina.3